MGKIKTVLFIQHATQFGGSAMSLLYTLQGIKEHEAEKFDIVVALAKWTHSLSEFYSQAGFKVVKADWIDTYEHTQLVHYNLLNPLHVYREVIQRIRIKRAIYNTERLIDLVKPDLVHLNSIVLLGSALAVKRKKISLVWHVREPSIKGMFGLRRALIKKYLRNIPKKVIFICHADMLSWGKPVNGIVVYNFTDFRKFDFNLTKPSQIEDVTIPSGDFIISYLGAVGRIKGGLYLIKAVNKLIAKYPDKKILMLFPGGIYDAQTYFIYRIAKTVLPFFGQGTYTQRIENEIKKSVNPKCFIKMKYVKDVAKVIAVSDVLVFPSIRPHFARPIIEAGAMAKPVIGSRLEGVEELIFDSHNGFLVKPKSVDDLVEKLVYFLESKIEISRMGMNGYFIAREKYQAKYNIAKIIEIYNSIFYSNFTN